MTLVACAALAGGAGSAFAAGYWSPPELVGKNDEMPSMFPLVGIAGDGTAVVVWMGWDGSQLDTELFYVTIRDGAQSEQTRVHELNACMDRLPRMSVGEDSVPWLIWERYGDGYEQVVSHWMGDGWSPPQTVFTQGGRYDQFAIYAGDSEDVWAMKSSRANARADFDIFLRRWDGESWGDVEIVGLGQKDDMSPVMVRDREGTAWLAWMCDEVAPPWGSHVYSASRDSLGWSAPVVVDTLPGNIFVTDIDLCPDGRPIVVWTGNGYQPTGDVEYAVFGHSGWEYGGLVNTPDDPRNDTDGAAKLSLGENGELWVVWVSASRDVAMSSSITCAQWRGDGWSEEKWVSEGNTLGVDLDCHAEAAVADDGVVWCVWSRYENIPAYDQDIFLSRRVVPWGADGSGAILRAHPNPAKNGVWVDMLGATPRGGQLAIYNAAGRLVRRLPVSRGAARDDDEAVVAYWDLTLPGGEKVANGVYYVALEADGGLLGCGRTRIVVVR
jgi:hypothetical protein